MELLKGAPAIAALKEQVTADIAALQAKGIMPGLAIVRMGEKEDDLAYQRSAVKRAEDWGVSATVHALPGDAAEDELLQLIAGLNEDNSVDGILILQPLPRHIDGQKVAAAVCCAKDVDGITDGSLAAVFAGRGQGFAPCTAQACIELLDHYGIELPGKNVAVIGRSLVVGRPLAMLLLARNATVTVCHTRSVDMPAICRGADILIAAAGVAELVDSSYLRSGQIVIDVGINVDPEGKLTGDVKAQAAEGLVAALSPVPGGVGGLTTAVMVKHVVLAAQRRG